MSQRWALAVVFCAVLGAVGSTAQAQSFLERVPEVLVPEPHGQVRTRVGASRVPLQINEQDLPEALSPELSTACSKLEFNQEKQGRFYVVVPFEQSQPRTYGYADGNGRNLDDRKGLRQPGRVYLFTRDGTSDCVVYDFAQQF